MMILKHVYGKECINTLIVLMVIIMAILTIRVHYLNNNKKCIF